MTKKLPKTSILLPKLSCYRPLNNNPKRKYIFNYPRITFEHLKWKETSKTSNYWMFCQNIERFINPVGAFKLNDVWIGNLIEILVDCLPKRLSIRPHLPVISAVCYGLVNIAASKYWMFLHPKVGCTSNYWILSNSWNLA